MSPAADLLLLVEDHDLNLELMKLVLEAENFDVRIARSAQEALDLLSSLRPSVLVTDVQLPGMSGLELVRRLRQDSQFAAVRIVVVTSYAMESDRESALRAGCDGYFSKPIDTRTFGAAVRSLAARAG